MIKLFNRNTLKGIRFTLAHGSGCVSTYHGRKGKWRNIRGGQSWNWKRAWKQGMARKRGKTIDFQRPAPGDLFPRLGSAP